MALVDTPREISLNGVSFSETEIRVLKALFASQDLAKLSADDIRKTPEIGKGLISGAVANLKMGAAGGLHELNLTQEGRSLLGKV